MTTETAKKAEIAAAVTRDIFMRLNTMADMITMGERIAWGSDSAVMREAAEEIAVLRGKVAALDGFYRAVAKAAGDIEGLPDCHAMRLTWIMDEPDNGEPFITAGMIRRAAKAGGR